MRYLQEVIAAGFDELRRGDWEAALSSANKALAVSPSEPGALTLAGRAALMGQSARFAIEIFESLTERFQVADTWLDLARCYALIRHESMAIEAARRALDIKPDDVRAHLLIGELALSLGDVIEAGEHFRASLRLAPTEFRAYRGLARSATISPNSAEVRTMENILERGAEPAARAELHYALSYVFKAAGDDERFIQHMWAANAAQREVNSVDASAFAKTLSRFDRVFVVPRAEQAPTLTGRPTPIFIVGMPRSGTTLTEQIINGDPSVASGGEIDFVRGRLSKKMRGGLEDSVASRERVISPTLLLREMEAYQDLLSLIGPGCAFVTDKTPGNYHALGLLLDTFPGSPAVCMQRSAMDTCFSILQQPFDVRSPHTFDVDLLALAVVHYQRLTKVWLERYPERCLLLRYEQLVESPDLYARQAVDHCGLSWTDEMLAVHTRKSAVRTFSTRQVRKEINNNAVGGWKRFEEELRPLVDALRAQGIDVERD